MDQPLQAWCGGMHPWAQVPEATCGYLSKQQQQSNQASKQVCKQKHTKKFRLPIWLSLQHLESTYEDSNSGQEVLLGIININFLVMEVNLATRN